MKSKSKSCCWVIKQWINGFRPNYISDLPPRSEPCRTMIMMMVIVMMMMMKMTLVSSECDCDMERSLSPHCSDSGLCQCKPGASGRRCDSCLPGYTWRGGGASCTGTQGFSDLVSCYQWCYNNQYIMWLSPQLTCVTRSVWFVRTEEPASTSSAACVQKTLQVNKHLEDLTAQMMCGEDDVAAKLCDDVICAGLFCEKSICLKTSGCPEGAEGSASSLTSHLYLLTLSLISSTICWPRPLTRGHAHRWYHRGAEPVSY